MHFPSGGYLQSVIHKFLIIQCTILFALLSTSTSTGASFKNQGTEIKPATEAPIVSVLHHKNVQNKDSPIFLLGNDGNSHRIIYVEPMDNLDIHCSASYLTKWTSSIPTNIPPHKKVFFSTYSKRLEVSPPILSKNKNAGQNNKGKTRETYTNTFYYEIPETKDNETHKGGFGFVRCESTSNKSLATEIYIHALLPNTCNTNKDLAGGQTFINPEQRGKPSEGIDLSDKNIASSRIVIPCTLRCISLHMDLLPKLYTLSRNEIVQQVHGTEVISEDPNLLMYEETTGFTITYTGNDSYPASYKCKIGNEELEFPVRRKKGNLKGVYEENDRDSSGKQPGISCVGNTGKTGTASSIKGSNSNAIFMINCNFPYLCDSVKQCFGGGCSERTVPLIQSSRGETLSFPFNHGMVRCGGGRDIAFSYHYTFIGLDMDRYWLSDSFMNSKQNKDKNKKAIINFLSTEEIYDTSKMVNFTCQISSFVLIPNIVLALIYSSGELLPTNQDQAVFHNSQLAISSKVTTSHMARNMTGIICTAPWFNSTTNWIQINRTFIVKETVKPRIDKSKGDKIQYFDVGEANGFLNCVVLVAQPAPHITWTFPNKAIEKKVNMTATDTESFIKFPVIDESFRGKYTCVAENNVGNDKYEFTVDVQDPSFTWPMILAVVLASVITLASMFGLIYFRLKYLKANKKLRDLTDEEVREYLNGNSNYTEVKTPNIENILFLEFSPVFAIQEADLEIIKTSILGEGEFGKVYKGVYKGETVAVKTTKPSADITYFKYLLGELKIICYITKHENIVSLKGAVVSRIKERILPIVVELSPLGNLQAFIRKTAFEFKSLVVDDKISPELIKQYTDNNLPSSTSALSTLNFINWSGQIAAGMEHLASLKVIHGDLATRNILLFCNDVVKIADFGLSRQLYTYSKYVKKRNVALPWRWLALESIRFMEFSIESDVWSFGVTIWEIFSMASIPYPEIISPRGFLKLLTGGMRLEKPSQAPQNIFEKMQKCWCTKPEERPTFTELKDFFKTITETH